MMARVDEENDLTCYNSAMCTAKRVVKRLASALYTPPPSLDTKLARSLMNTEWQITLQCQFDGDSTVDDSKDDIEENDMSLSMIRNGEE